MIRPATRLKRFLIASSCFLFVICYQRVSWPDKTSKNEVVFLAKSLYLQIVNITERTAADLAESPQQAMTNCLLPSLEPDPKLFPPKDFKPSNCSANATFYPIRIVEGGFFEFNASNSEMNCYFAKVDMEDDFETRVEPYIAIPARSSTIPCPHDVFRVKCIRVRTCAVCAKNVVTFNEVFRCIRPNDKVIERIARTTFNETTLFHERLSILLIGLDSVGSVTWEEQMRKTHDLAINQLGGVSFEGYNIVGDGTTAAILGFTTGFREEELPESRRGYVYAKEVDNFPFIFTRLRNKFGYVTLWDEDAPNLGTFHYRLLGFKRPPVDYYGRHFQLELGSNPPDCLGPLSPFQEMMQQFRHLFAAYPDPIRKFALVMSSKYSHTAMYGGGVQVVYRIDHQLADEIKQLHDLGHLNQSVLVLFSDHGSRFGASRATQRGKIIERLPYLALVFPQWFQEQYKEEIGNLREATKRLTTPFDLHATLLDIAGIKAVPGTPKRGISFFKPIPKSRACQEAGVLPHWCACLDRGSDSTLSLNDSLVTRCLSEFERYVNKDLLGERQNECEMVRAVRPFFAQRLSLGSKVVEFVKTFDAHGRRPRFEKNQTAPADLADYVQVSFWTEPGDGQWEATFLHRRSNGAIELLPKQISRTNRYGSAPKCIADRYPHLRQFCYCHTDW